MQSHKENLMRLWPLREILNPGYYYNPPISSVFLYPDRFHDPPQKFYLLDRQTCLEILFPHAIPAVSEIMNGQL